MVTETARRFTTTQVIFAALATIIGTLILVKVFQILSGPAPADSPVKVRGGAMTFRTKKNVKWEKLSSNSYCVSLGTTTSPTVTIELYQHGNDSSTPDKQATLSSGAQVDLFGYSGNGNSASNNGVQILITTSCAGSNGLSAQLQPEGANSSFYQNRDNAPDSSNRHLVRFQDLSCSPNPPSASADEDTCEHLNYVNVPTASPSKWDCTDGECRVEIHP